MNSLAAARPDPTATAQQLASRWLDNHQVALRLREVAAQLQDQQANPFRINAYRYAADSVESCDRQVAVILQHSGHDGLLALPGIGEGLATTIEEIVRTGRASLADRINGADDSVGLIQCLPGVGPELALRIQEALHVRTLADLETAAYDGRLDKVPGIGPRRLEAIRNALTVLLQKRGGRAPQSARARLTVPVAEILDVDAEYRHRGAADELVRIAPRRFNPDGVRWLPILHTERGDHHYTALFSNTARAHQLKRTRDWVVVYFYDDHHREGRATVVTETRGPMKGRRVVRGREAECREIQPA